MLKSTLWLTRRGDAWWTKPLTDLNQLWENTFLVTFDKIISTTTKNKLEKNEKNTPNKADKIKFCTEVKFINLRFGCFYDQNGRLLNFDDCQGRLIMAGETLEDENCPGSLQEWHGLDGVGDACSISVQGLFGTLNSLWSKLMDLLRSLSPRIELLREKTECLMLW